MAQPELPPDKDALLAELVKSGYVVALQDWMRNMCAPLWWAQSVRGQSAPYTCGTVCFVDTGTARLGITAAHIHREVMSHKERDPAFWCQLGGHMFDPGGHLVDIDDELDLAVYSVSDVMLGGIGASMHHAPEWPPTVAEQDVVLVCGFPWSLSESEIATGIHKFLWFACRPQKSGESQLGALSFTSTSIAVGAIALAPGTNLGGMSGGPVYRLREAPLSQLVLTGIIHQYQPSYELFLIRPLSVVNPDGMLVKSSTGEA
jgi:hypothetical protein